MAQSQKFKKIQPEKRQFQGIFQPKNVKKQDKYTMDPGQSSLSQQKVKKFQLKMIFEQKKIKKMHKSCIIND